MEASTSKPSRSTPSKAKSSEGELPEYEAALEVGYLGAATDTRPNEEYTVAGVIARAEEGPPNIAEEGDPDHAKAEYR